MILSKCIIVLQVRVLERCSAPSSSVTPGTPPSSSSCSHTPSWVSPCLRLWVSSVLWWRSCCCSLSKLFTFKNTTTAIPHDEVSVIYYLEWTAMESNVWKPHPHSDAWTDVYKWYTYRCASSGMQLFNYVEYQEIK